MNETSAYFINKKIKTEHVISTTMSPEEILGLGNIEITLAINKVGVITKL